MKHIKILFKPIIGLACLLVFLYSLYVIFSSNSQYPPLGAILKEYPVTMLSQPYDFHLKSHQDKNISFNSLADKYQTIGIYLYYGDLARVSSAIKTTIETLNNAVIPNDTVMLVLSKYQIKNILINDNSNIVLAYGDDIENILEYYKYKDYNLKDVSRNMIMIRKLAFKSGFNGNILLKIEIMKNLDIKSYNNTEPISPESRINTGNTK